jgi:hypothetical protein
MSIAGLFRLMVAACAAAALFAAAPARAHNGGSQSTAQFDPTHTYQWVAWADLSSPTDSSTIGGAPVNITVTSNSGHQATVSGPANASISVSYSFWVSNDYTQVGNGKSATNLAVNLDIMGNWSEAASRSGTANGVDVGNHHGDAFSSITVAGAFNYASTAHFHYYDVNP